MFLDVPSTVLCTFGLYFRQAWYVAAMHLVTNKAFGLATQAQVFKTLHLTKCGFTADLGEIHVFGFKYSNFLYLIELACCN